jgi:hypothetical protein
MKIGISLMMISLASIVISCSKSSNNSSGSSPHTCNFSAISVNAPANGSVKYETKLTGTGQVTQIVIKTASGDSTISSPILPFQVTLQVSSGVALGISVTGNTSVGTIDIEYSFTPTGGGSVVKYENSCGN